MRQVWLAISTPVNKKLLLLEMNEGERYGALPGRSITEIHNILKTQ
jgi:hypothetical protein